MSLLSAPHHKPTACSDGTHPGQEVKTPKVFALWYKRAAPDEMWVKEQIGAQVIFPPTCAAPDCARHLLAQPSEGGLNTRPPWTKLEAGGFQ